MRGASVRACSLYAFAVLALVNIVFADSFVTNIIDNDGDVGSYCSIAIDSNQNPIIAYRSDSNDCIKFATIEDVNYKIEFIPATAGLGYGLSLAVDNFGGLGISHSYGTDLIFSFKTSWFDWQTTIAAYGDCWTTALAFSENDVPHIAYADLGNQIRHATYDIQANSWVTQPVSFGLYDFPSIAVGSSDEIVIAFEQWGNLIHVAINSGFGWMFLPSFDGSTPSMALNSVEQPAVAYIHSGRLYFTNYTPIGWIPAVVDDGSQGPVSGPLSLAFDNNGNAAIAYLRDGQLTYAANHAGWLIGPVDESDADIQHIDLVFDSNNMPFIAFYDGSSNWDGTSLKLAGPGLIPTCVADLNRDGRVNFIDYALFAIQWNESGAGIAADFDGSGSVDGVDLMVFCSYWLWDRNE